MEKQSQHSEHILNFDQSIRHQEQSGNDIKSQIAQHAEHLLQPEISDEEKINLLIQLISLAVSVAENNWNDIITTSGVIETVSGLILETTNPKIRTLCGAAIEVIQQWGKKWE
ncbi:MAG: hypothetical protein EZS28_026458 [Streblomastix strix]|uniref:Uncharacterized protein n=1 Tax=Streblomastix strix TaxID=222440 RepID=A0A5J4V7C5_9EUKA|nr:MAG: hypothetical protein EZS28_026458 [Streblomastix strix]